MTGKLFTIEYCSAPDMGRPAGDWLPTGKEADTLDEAKALEKAVYAQGWVYTRIVANHAVAESHRDALDKIAKGPPACDAEWIARKALGRAP